MSELEPKGHSEEFFGDFRDYWYNHDFLELMAKRWELENVEMLLDVGCGQGHWTRIVSQFLRKGSNVTAVDSDPKWGKENEQLKDIFAAKGIGFQMKEADVLNLPFEDNSFDAVTCQTVLIHIQNPLEALKEMKRVLKPNGILFCAEPNNLVAWILKDSISANLDIDEIIEWFTYGLIKEKGKIRMGNGDNSIGDLLSGLFCRLGLKDVNAYLSDKANVINPPYESKEISSMLEFRLDNKYEEFMKAETEAQFAVFGDKFDSIRDKMLTKKDMYKSDLRTAIKKEEYYDVSTALMYLVSGRK